MKAVQIKGKSVKLPHEQPISDSVINFFLVSRDRNLQKAMSQKKV